MLGGLFSCVERLCSLAGGESVLFFNYVDGTAHHSMSVKLACGT